MKRRLSLLLLTALGCRAGAHVCPVVAFAGATPHSVEGDVAARLLAQEGRARICIQVVRHPSYQEVGSPAAEVALAQRVAAEDDVMVVVGHVTSRGSLAAAPVYRAAGIVQIVPVGTSRLLRGVGSSLFDLVPDDSAEGKAMAAYGSRVVPRGRALVVYVADEYGQGLLNGLRVGLAGRGLSIGAAVPVLEGSDIATLTAAALHRGRPDIAFILGDYRVAGDVARELHARLPALALIGSDAALYPRGLAEHAGPALGSLRLVSFRRPDSTTVAAARYLAVFRAVAGRDPTPDEALTHDALMLAAAAIDSAGTDRAEIRDWLATLGASHPAWPGVTGPVQFARPDPAAFTVLRIQGDAAVPVTPR